jgi:hypothetical protein
VYYASFDTTQKPSDQAFWGASPASFTDANGNVVEYVIHRMCELAGAYNQPTPANHCMQTAANTSTLNNSVAVGDSLASDSQQLNGSLQIHYIITARIRGPRGGNVLNQMVVMIGA